MYKLPVIRQMSTRDIIYNMINIINTIAKYERVNPKSSHHKENMFYSPSLILYLWDDGESLNLLGSSFHNVSHYAVYLKLIQCYMSIIFNKIISNIYAYLSPNIVFLYTIGM